MAFGEAEDGDGCPARPRLSHAARWVSPSFDRSSFISPAREASNVRQPVFARYLNTSESTVEKRETGAKRPSSMALKLLTIVQKHGQKVLA